MDEKPPQESPSSSFFSVPESHWSDVGSETYRDLSRLYVTLGLVLSALKGELQRRGEEAPEAAIPTDKVPLPSELAFQLHEIAGQMMSRVAADEQDLRQIISTLRTAFTVSWDLYSFRESEQTTVAEHMQNLKTRIEDFEKELAALQRAKHPDTPASPD